MEYAVFTWTLVAVYKVVVAAAEMLQGKLGFQTRRLLTGGAGIFAKKGRTSNDASRLWNVVHHLSRSPVIRQGAKAGGRGGGEDTFRHRQ